MVELLVLFVTGVTKKCRRARWLLITLIFERQPDLGSVGFHLAIRDHHVLLDDFCYAEFAQGVRGCFYGSLGRLLPGFCACVACPSERYQALS